MNKDSNIFICGSGFVGTNVYNQLIKRGYKNTELLGRARVDLSDKVEVDFLFDNNKIDYVILSGALVGGIQANMINQYNFLLQNLLIQNNVIPNCVKHNIKSVILGSSCIYPKGYDILIEEDLLTAPLEPTNEGYSLAKIAGLKLAEYANREQDGKLISLMPCNIYGPKDNFDLNNSHVLSALVKKICDNGEVESKSLTLQSRNAIKYKFDKSDWFLEELAAEIQ
jgi:GDP-L-fucose synthase